MIWNKENAYKTAENLLQIKAIKLQPQDPFTWASGWRSPIYCDNRLSLSYPDIRKFVAQSLAELIKEKYQNVEVIAGVATGAIAIGILVAEVLDKPFVYVRSSAKAHGRQNKVEGHLPENSSVVVVEDLISTGKSSLDAVEALEAMGANVQGMVAIFSYGFGVADENFSKASCELTTLSNYNYLLEHALQTGYINNDQMDILQEWRTNPSEWGK